MSFTKLAVLATCVALVATVGAFAARDFVARHQLAPVDYRRAELMTSMKRLCVEYRKWAEWARRNGLETSQRMDQRCAFN